MGDFQDIKKAQKNFNQSRPYELLHKSYSNLSQQSKRFLTQSRQSNQRPKLNVNQNDQAAQTLETFTVQDIHNIRAKFSKSQIHNLKDNFRGSLNENTFQQMKCPLNDPELPPVSEVDHQCSRCYCDLCTCGQHKCPCQRKNNLYPISMFTSHYSNNFQVKKGLKQEKLKLHEGYSLSNRAKMETQTTKMQDFKFIEIPKEYNPYAEMKQNRPKTTVVRSKFCGLTSYQQNFPN